MKIFIHSFRSTLDFYSGNVGSMGGGTFFKVGGHKCTLKTI